MPDILLLQGAITSLKSAFDITQALIGLKVGAEVNSKILDLQREIMAAQSSAFSAQSEQFLLSQRVRDLEKEIASVKAWEMEKKRYQLVDVSRGAFAHALKADSKESEPPHWICAKCYQDGKKSILQHNGNAFISESRARCPTCKSEIADHAKSRQIEYV